MSVYENVSHGTTDFPIGVHDTYYADGFRLYPHVHREFEFLILTEGDGIISIEGQEYRLEKGDGIFVNSRELHSGRICTAQASEFFAIVFSPDIFGSSGNDLIMDKFVFPVINKKIILPVLYSKEISWQNDVLHMAHEIHSLYTKQTIASELLVKSLLFNIWNICFLHGTNGDASGGVSRIDEIKSVLEYVRTEYASSITLKDMAKKANMSSGHFCRCFSEIMHITPFAYLMHIRIDNACRMLREEKLSVGETAIRCGFNSFSYFSMRFNEIVGCTPRQYVKLHADSMK